MMKRPIKRPIIRWDLDKATYVGDGEDGCYYQIGEKTWGPSRDRGYYVTVIVDCNSAHFTNDLLTEMGAYETRWAAAQVGLRHAIQWCIDNDVNYKGEDEDG